MDSCKQISFLLEQGTEPATSPKRPRGPRPRVTSPVVCQVCGESFYPLQTEFRRAQLAGGRMFCNRECSGKKQWENKARTVPGDKPGWLERDYRRIFAAARKNAKRRKIEWQLSPADVERLIMRAQGKCELSKKPFSAALAHRANGRREYAPSLDRIDSAGIYEFGNCRLVLFAVNAGLNDWGDSVLFEVAEALVEARREQGTVIRPRQLISHAKIERDLKSALLQATHDRDTLLTQCEIEIWGRTQDGSSLSFGERSVNVRREIRKRSANQDNVLRGFNSTNRGIQPG
jgi:hypothetical protein